jgi:prevent-host-death family protein
MVREMTATELKAKLLAVLDEVEQGEEITITRRGRTIARLSALRGAHALEGSLRGIARTAPNVTDEDLFSTGENWDLP